MAASIESLQARVKDLEGRIGDRDARIAALESAVTLAEAAAMPQVRLQGGRGEAVVFLHGAHVTSWKVAGVEQLFCSAHAVFKPPKAIRGGIPVCWPQFGDLGPLAQQHGFARNCEWQAEADPGGHAVTLRLSSATVADPALLAGWDKPFALEMRVELEGDTLVQTLKVTNPGPAAFAFTAALHTYFAVADVGGAAVSGLQGCSYLDSLDGRAEKVDGGADVTFDQEVDRIYLGAPRQLTVVQPSLNTCCELDTSPELADAVVWNPWADKAARMGDFGDGEYRGMVCVEAATVKPATNLAPGAAWAATQTLRAVGV